MSSSDTNSTSSESDGGHYHIKHDLENLVIIWLGVFCCNLVSKKVGISALVLHLMLGCFYVNVGILDEKPSLFQETLSELAITIVMFSIGFEENVKSFIGERRWFDGLSVRWFECIYIFYVLSFSPPLSPHEHSIL